MMSNYQNEYVLLARTLYQQKVNLAGMFSVLGGGFNYKFAKEQPEVSQYMMDTNHWYNPKSAQAQALKKRVEAAGKEFTFEVYLAYTVVGLLADSLERAGSADKEKLTAALASSTYKAEIMLRAADRGAAIIDARGLSSAASAANAAIEHMRTWTFGTAEGGGQGQGNQGFHVRVLRVLRPCCRSSSTSKCRSRRRARFGTGWPRRWAN